MKKIIIAFDGSHYSEGAFEFVRLLNEVSPILLTGVFLPKLEYIDLWNYTTGMNSPLAMPLVESGDRKTSEKTIEEFKERCRKHGIEHRVHSDIYGLALPELKKETRFANLLVIGGENFYKYEENDELNEYLRDTLRVSECPVLVVPEHFNFPKTNILAYDGSGASVFAIKQFSYLFPELAQNRTLLVYAKEETAGTSIPDEEYAEELISRSFPNLTIMKLHLDPDKHFAPWISEKKPAIIVSGSFGRSPFSLLFRKSFVTQVIKDHKLPVFIAHQ